MKQVTNILFLLTFITMTFVIFQLSTLIQYLMYRVEIQKQRADKIELFLVHNYKGVYIGKETH